MDGLAAAVLLGVQGVCLVAGNLGRLDLRLKLLPGGLYLLLRFGLQALLLLLQGRLRLLGQVRLLFRKEKEKNSRKKGCKK